MGVSSFKFSHKPPRSRASSILDVHDVVLDDEIADAVRVTAASVLTGKCAMPKAPADEKGMVLGATK